MRTVDVIKQARVLIKIGWCRGASAKDGQGRKVKLNSKYACAFDLMGALHRASPVHGIALANAISILQAKVGGELIPWNDAQKNKGTVIQMLTEVIDDIEGTQDPRQVHEDEREAAHAAQAEPALHGRDGAGPVQPGGTEGTA